MQGFTVQEASQRSGWSPRMLRYVENTGLVVPRRSPAGYRLYDVEDVDRLRRLGELRRRYGLELTEVAFARRLSREPDLQAAVESWLAHRLRQDWLRFEQRKHEQLLAA